MCRILCPREPGFTAFDGLIWRSGSEAELALLFGPVDRQVAAEHQATGQPFGVSAIGNPFNNFRAKE